MCDSACDRIAGVAHCRLHPETTIPHPQVDSKIMQRLTPPKSQLQTMGNMKSRTVALRSNHTQTGQGRNNSLVQQNPKPICSTTGIRGQRTITTIIVRCNTRTARQPYAHGSTVLPWSRTRPRRRAQQGCESGSITQTTVPELISVRSAPDQLVELYSTYPWVY